MIRAHAASLINISFAFDGSSKQVKQQESTQQTLQEALWEKMKKTRFC